MIVLKFGGTSVGSVENVKRIAEILKSQHEKIIVVVSALGGVTDKLLAVAQKAAMGVKTDGELIAVRTRHEEMINGLFKVDDAEKTIFSLQPLFDELEKSYRAYL
jgi:aspartokinase/homoserine dehydrogenase 1